MVLSQTGSLAFGDVDLSDTHVPSQQFVSATWSGGAGVPADTLSALQSALTTTLADASTGDGAGAIGWSFTLQNGLADFLAAGETLSVAYEVTVTDQPTGASDTTTVTVTIIGTNDAPVFGPSYAFASGLDGVDGSLVSNGGSFAIVDSGSAGIVTEDGSAYAQIDGSVFTRFEGYGDSWRGDYMAEAKVWLDTSWTDGEGFDYSVAINDADGNHLRDFIFHVSKDSSTGALLVGGSNNTNFAVRRISRR